MIYISLFFLLFIIGIFYFNIEQLHNPEGYEKMTEIPMEELLPRAGYSIYKLVSMASKRALELSDGKRCLAENINTEKFTTMALQEIAQGKVEIKGVGGSMPPQKEDSGESEEEDQEEE